ncbi:MAG: 3-phosphoshikimate 1-carboxyvinyltransferase [Bacillota bacterium]|jgi:3-phosphoshikimate 1-carboxyvinyltransferase
MSELRIWPVTRLKGRCRVPGDKSISHRAALLGALAKGTTRVRGFLWAGDPLATLDCLHRMAVPIARRGTELFIHGQGKDGLQTPGQPLDARNSGTTARLLMGLLAGAWGERTGTRAIITGDQSLQKRPMRRVVDPLRMMGADVRWVGQEGCLPLAVIGGSPLQGREYHLPVATAQVKGALLLAGLHSQGTTVVCEDQISRDHTERMLPSFGVAVQVSDVSGGQRLVVQGGQHLVAGDVVVPGDISSAAFLVAAALLVPDAELVLTGVGLNPTRTGFLQVVQTMGGQVEVVAFDNRTGEPVGDLLIRGGQDLHGTTIDHTLIPRLVDEIPVLAVLACFAHGETVIRDAQELRYKESDRLRTLALELNRLGGEVAEQPDGLVIRGQGGLRGGKCDSHGDHRLALAFATAGLAAQEPVSVLGAECMDVSFPGFSALCRRLIS